MVILSFLSLSVFVSSVQGKGFSEADSWFIIVSDVHTSNDQSKMEKMNWLVSEINGGEYDQVDFLVITGDCVSSFLEKREMDPDDPSNNRVMKLMNVLQKSEKPVYLVMGNHEYKIDKQKDSDDPFTQAELDTIDAMWKRYTGLEPWYSFREGGMKYIVLNTMSGIPDEKRFSDGQMEWFREELSGGEPVVLFFHHPVQTDHMRIWGHKEDLVREDNEPEFMAILEENRSQIRGIFVGHGHLWTKDRLYKEIPVFETASFGDRPKVLGYLVGMNSDNKIKETEKIFREQSKKTN